MAKNQFSFMAVVLILIGLGAYSFDQHLGGKSRLTEPVLTEATFVDAKCSHLIQAKGSIEALGIEYSYEPLNSTASMKLKLRAYEARSFQTVEECEKQRAAALMERKSKSVWYENVDPTKYKFSLEPRDSSIFLWWFLTPAFLLAILGFVFNKSASDKKSIKKFKKHKL